jgi:hypothetical protein
MNEQFPITSLQDLVVLFLLYELSVYFLKQLP